MKNNKSPFKFVGAAIGTAAGALGTQHILGRLGGLFGGGGGNAARHTGVGGLGEQYSGIGSNPMASAGPTAQFNPAEMQNMQGIFGNTNARQASLGASGMMALEKHLSPVNQGEELTAYADDTNTLAYDDGAGGTDYEAKARDDKKLENLKFTTDKNSLNLTGTYDPKWGSKEDLKTEGYI
tara:strand:+ start:141 stop:683 length:543 start_codon:yes stop_codon:yes gene_type:complete